jgi:hypothetical protein
LHGFPDDIKIGDIIVLDCLEKLPFGLTQEQLDKMSPQFKTSMLRDAKKTAPPQFWTHTYPLWLWGAPGINSNIRLEIHVPEGVSCIIQDLYMKSYKIRGGKKMLFKTIGFGACSMKVEEIDFVKGFIFQPDITTKDVKCVKCKLLMNAP